MPPTTMHSILMKKEKAHEDPIYCCAWATVNTNGDSNVKTKDYIVTSGLDCNVKIWVFENNKLELVHLLQDHLVAVNSVAVSPDGHTLASASLDSIIMIWDLVSGTKVHEIQTEALDVWMIVFSPDGTKLASGSHIGRVSIYGIEKGILETVLDTRGKFCTSIAWSPNGKWITTGSVEGVVCVFNMAQGRLLHIIEAHTKLIRGIAFSCNSNLIVTASDDGEVKIYNVANGAMVSRWDHKCIVTSARFSSDGSRVATGAADGAVRIATVDGLKIIHTFQEHSDMVCDLQFNLAGDKLVSVAKDNCINIYECPIPPKVTKNNN